MQCSGGDANDAGINQRCCRSGAQPAEHEARAEELARATKGEDGFAAIAYDRRLLDAAALDEECRISRIALRIIT
jgi:hypothetical protein